MRLQFRQMPDAGLKFFVDIAGDDDHFLDDFLFVIKLRKSLLQFDAQLLEFLLHLFLATFLLRLLPRKIFRVHVRIHRVNLLDELAQILQVTFAVGDFFINNDAVETLFRRVGQNLFRDGDMLLRREAKVIDDVLHLHFRVLNFFANLHFLFAGEQRHFTHLVHIHPNRIVQNFQSRIIFDFFRLRLIGLLALGAFGLGLIHDDFHVKTTELRQQCVEIFRTQIIWQNIINVVVSNVAVFLRQVQQRLHCLGQIHRRQCAARRGRGRRVGRRFGGRFSRRFCRRYLGNDRQNNRRWFRDLRFNRFAGNDKSPPDGRSFDFRRFRRTGTGLGHRNFAFRHKNKTKKYRAGSEKLTIDRKNYGF